jgi:hypothetical protein
VRVCVSTHNIRHDIFLFCRIYLCFSRGEISLQSMNIWREKKGKEVASAKVFIASDPARQAYNSVIALHTQCRRRRWPNPCLKCARCGRRRTRTLLRKASRRPQWVSEMMRWVCGATARERTSWAGTTPSESGAVAGECNAGGVGSP